MISRSALITLFVLLFAAASFGQGFTVSFTSLTQPLTTACGSGTPLPDGTPVLIFVDPEFDGPTADDYQPVVGTDFAQVSYNSFNINGVAIQEGAGLFANNPYWESYFAVPDPPYYYLLVCANGVQYYSSTFFVTAGYQEFHIPDATMEYTWTCLNETCDNICLPPSQPTALDATDDLCNGINLTWNHDGVDICAFDIIRDDETIARTTTVVPPFSYSDTGALNGLHTYRVKAVRCCPDESQVFSGTSTPSNGHRLPGPPVPILQSVSDGVCDTIKVTVLMVTVQGLNELRFYRVGTPNVLIGTVTNAIAGAPITVLDLDPPEGEACYYAVGYSTSCAGEGTPSATLCGSANFAPECIPVITSVSTDLCDRITITWTYDCVPPDADNFQIRRNTNVIATVAGNVFTYDDLGTAPGVNTGYAIIPVNECGPGTPSAVVIGHRASVPTAPTGVTTVGQCNCITVNWNEVAGTIINYRVYRNNILVGTVTPPAHSFEDCDPALAPGIQYPYNVTASNVCGESPHSANVNGALLPQNTGGATLALVSAGPPNWDYSLTWASGCVNTLTIRSLCPETTADFIGTGWTETVYDEGDSVVWVADNPLDGGTVTGFRLTNTTDCAGTGSWTAGSGEGSIEGPLPVGRVFEIPKEYALSVYPNPFNPATTLEFALPKAGMVYVNVYDIIGRLVSEVVSGEFEAGFHKVNFDATSLPSGLYFARINSRDFVTTKKLMLVK